VVYYIKVIIIAGQNFFLTHGFNPSILSDVSGAAYAVKRESC